jgi:hypothetical protein
MARVATQISCSRSPAQAILAKATSNQLSHKRLRRHRGGSGRAA